MTLKLAVKRPAECNQADLDAFVAMVEAGGEVEAASLRSRVRKAVVLAFMTDNAKLVGVGGLKRPSHHHTAAVFSASEVDEAPKAYKYELGWVVVAPSHRGQRLSRAIVAPLIQEAEGDPSFATSVDSNIAMHSTLRRCGFVQRGHSFPSPRRNVRLLLFIRRA